MYNNTNTDIQIYKTNNHMKQRQSYNTSSRYHILRTKYKDIAETKHDRTHTDEAASSIEDDDASRTQGKVASGNTDEAASRKR